MINNMNFNTGPVIIDGGLRKYMTGVFNKMFLALGVTGFVAFFCSSSATVLAAMSSGVVSLFLMLAMFGIVVYLSSSRIRKISIERANGLFWLYAALLGAILSPIFAVYTKSSIANSFFTAAFFFAGMSFYGYTTKKDLTNVRSFAVVGLITLLITSFVNAIFLHSSLLQLSISAVLIVVFCALTAYDIQKIKEIWSFEDNDETVAKKATIGALVLYLDFVNLFLHLLNFLGVRRD